MDSRVAPSRSPFCGTPTPAAPLPAPPGEGPGCCWLPLACVMGSEMICREVRDSRVWLTLLSASWVTSGKQSCHSSSELSYLKDGVIVPVLWGVEGVLCV